MEGKLPVPNAKLRYQRQTRGWSQKRLADLLDTSKELVGRWERGIQQPSPYYQEKLCVLFEKTAEDLGFIQASIHQGEITIKSYTNAIVQQPVSNFSANSGFDHTYTSIPPEEPLSLGNSSKMLESDADMDTLRREILEGMFAVFGLSLTGKTFLDDVTRTDIVDQFSRAVAEHSHVALDDEIVSRFTKLTEGYWRLMNESGLAVAGPAIEQALSTYLSKLDKAAQKQSKYQYSAAHLASQGHLLASLTAWDHLKYAEMETESALAVKYSKIARDYNLYAAALKQQATIHMVAKDRLKALRVYQQTLPFIKRVSPLLQSRIYQGLASASARCGLEEDAHRYLGLASDTFPDDFEHDPSFLYADSDPSVLHLYRGLTYLDLEDPRAALDALEKVDGLHPKMAIGDWTRLEFLNLQAKAAAMMRDQEKSLTYLETAVQIANNAESRYGQNDTFYTWQNMRLVWPKDQRIKKLGSLFKK